MRAISESVEHHHLLGLFLHLAPLHKDVSIHNVRLSMNNTGNHCILIFLLFQLSVLTRTLIVSMYASPVLSSQLIPRVCLHCCEIRDNLWGDCPDQTRLSETHGYQSLLAKSVLTDRPPADVHEATDLAPRPVVATPKSSIPSRPEIAADSLDIRWLSPQKGTAPLHI